MTTVALVDDHTLIIKLLAYHIDMMEGFGVIALAANGIELMERIKEVGSPDILLLDLDMPHMGGYATAAWLKKNHPDTKILMLSMYAPEAIMVKLVKMGVKGFLPKHITLEELHKALQEVLEKGFYFARGSGEGLLELIQTIETQIASRHNILLTDREIALIKFCCSEDSSTEIADKMGLSRRTVDDMKAVIFNKIGVHSRTGLAVYALRYGLIHL